MIIFLKRLASSILTPVTGKVAFFVDENGLPKVKDENGVISDFTGPQGATGPQGSTGPQGPAATINVGTTTTGAAGSNASVTNSGSSSAAIFNFTVPAGATGPTGATGATGPQGSAATIAVGTVTTGAAGSSVTINNSGTSSSAIFDFTIPRGDTGATGATGPAGTAATITVGTVTTGAAGSSAIITNSGSSSAATFDFTIPRGDTGATGATGSTGPQGPAATITVGTVTTGAPGSSAVVTNVGTSGAAVFDFTIPEGQPGSSTQTDTAFNIADATDATKKIKFDAGGTTSTTTTIAAAQTANRIINLPDANTTLVGTDTTDTLTNKTLSSPDLTGTPTATTATTGTNSTRIATTAFVQDAISKIPATNHRNVGGSGYASIAAAIASCTSPSITNRYLINVDVGTYSESTLVVPSYVYIVGQDERAVIVEPAGTHDVFQINNDNVYISFLTIANAPTGYAGIRVTDAGDYSLLHKVHITDCDYGLIVNTTTSATNDTLFYTEYCDIEECNSPLTVTSTHGTFWSYDQNENLYVGNYVTPFTGAQAVLVTGKAQAVFNNGTIENLANPNNGIGLKFHSGAILDITGTIINQWQTGINCPNTGDNPSTTIRFVNLTNNTTDLDIAHIGLSGVVAVFADITKINLNASVNIMLKVIDPVNNGVSNIGALNLGQSFTQLNDYSHAIIEQTSTGLLSGGDVTYSSSSLNLDVALGSGYLLTGTGPTDYLKFISFAAQSVTLSANSTTYLAIDNTGTLASSSTPFSQQLYLKLGAAVTNASGVVLYKNIPRRTNNISSQIEEMLRDVIGASFKNGCIVTENGTTARALNVTTGEYYFGSIEFAPAGGTAVAMTGLYRNGSGGWTTNSLTQVPNTVYDNNSGTPVSLTATYYANFYLYLANDGTSEKYFLVYGQNQYVSSSLADAESLPTVPSWVTENVVSIARIMVRQGTTNTISIKDLRPFSSAGSAVSIPVTSVFTRTGDIVATAGDYTASQVTNVPSGNLAAVTVQAALDELQTDIDTRATSSALTTHTGASTGVHGVTGSVVGTTDTQTLTNKTIVAANNTITTAASGNLTSTSLNAALAELQTDIDTRALNSDLTTHTGSTAAHGATGAVMGTTNTQTVTNKTLVDSSTAIADVTDNTKQIKFDAGGTTATSTTILAAQTANRTITLPDATDTVAVLATAQTLTNKTISGASNTITNVSLTTGVTGTLPIGNGGTGQTTAAAAFNALSPITTTGDLIIGNGTNSATRLAVGTNGQVLTSNGTTASWSTPAASSGAGSLNTIFQLTGSDQATWSTGNNATFLTAGTLIGAFTQETASPLQGANSYKFVQGATSINDWLASPAQAVDIKFRGQQAFLTAAYSYDGASTDIVWVVYDATNSTIISLSTDFVVATSGSVSTAVIPVTIPASCASIRVGLHIKVTNNTKTLRYDSISLDTNIYSGANVTSFDQIEALTASSTYGSTNTGVSVLTITKQPTAGFLTIVSTAANGTYIQVNTNCNLDINVTATATTAGNVYITRNATTLTAVTPNGIIGYSTVGATSSATASATISAIAGDLIRIQSSLPANTTISAVTFGASAISNNIVSPTTQTSNDTMSFVFSTSALTGSEAIGTFNTYTYTANTNTVALSSTAPTQTTASMATDGLLIYARNYANASTSAQPARIDIVIGKGYKGMAFRTYTDNIKSSIIFTDYLTAGSNEYGVKFLYKENTGILTIDCGYKLLLGTTYIGVTEAGGAATSGYVNFSASKAAAIAAIPTVTPNIDTQFTVVDATDSTKKIMLDAGGTTATTTTITATQTASRVVTLPDATDTLVGRATTDTLTNKTIVAANNTITTAASGNLTSTTLNAALAELQTDIDTRALSSDLTTHTGSTAAHGATGAVMGTTNTQTVTNKSLSDSTTFVVDVTDATKRIAFDAAGTTGTTTTLLSSQTTNKTLTLPDATDTIAVLATAQTFTNKTISGASNTITNISLTTGVTGTLPIGNGGTNITTYATGDLLYASAANTLSKLPIGTATQVLTVSGGVPTWAAAGGGGGGTPGGSTTQIQYNNAGAFAGATNALIDNNDLTLVTNATPVSPAAGNVKLFARNLANRIFPAFVGTTGQDSALQPGFHRNSIGLWKPPGNATTVPGVFGFTAFTATGTATARNVATTNVLTRTKRLGYVSAATAAALCGARVAVAQFTTGDGAGFGGFYTAIRFGISDAATVAGARMFVGVSSNTAAPTNVEPNTLTNSIGVAQLSTDATQLYIVYGGSTAQTAIALGATNFPINTTNVYDLHLFSPINATGVVHYTIFNCNNNTSASGTLSGAATVIPAATTLLTHQIWRTNNATAAAVGIDIINVYIENDI